MRKSLTLFTLLCVLSIVSFGQSGSNSKKTTVSNMDFNAKEARYLKIKNSANKAPKSLVLKQDSIIEQVFDTISNLWVYECQSKMAYDNQGRNNYVFMQNWDVAQNKWIDAEKEYLTFDNNNNNNITNYLTLEWNVTDNRWDSSYKNATIYNVNNLMTLYNSYNWDSSTNLWVNGTQTIIQYNENNLDTSKIHSSWDSGNSTWKIDEKFVYKYDATSNLVEEYRYTWNSTLNQLDTFNMNRYFYDLSNKKIKSEEYGKWSGNMELIETNYYTYNSNQLLAIDSAIMQSNINVAYYLYDANDHLLQELRKYHDGIEMQNNSKNDYVYNAIGKITNEDRYTWVNDAWRKDYKYERSFDNNGNLINFMCGGYYNMANGNYFAELQSGNRQVLIYDLNYNASQIALYYEEDSEENKMDTTTWESYNYTNTSWFNTERTVYYYSSISPNGFPENETSRIRVYPNPATDYVLVDSKDLSTNASILIFDTFGRMVINQAINGKVSVKGLSNGIYFYTINNDGKVATGKLIVE